MPERIRALVYLDAFVPEVSQDSVFGKANPERMAAFQKQIDAGAIGLEPDGALESWTSDPNARDWLQRQCTPHPPKTLQAGPILTGQQSRIEHRHYILAAKNDPSAFQAEYRRLQSQQGWTFDSMPTWHDAMVEAPEDLAARLDEYSAHLPDLSKEARI